MRTTHIVTGYPMSFWKSLFGGSSDSAEKASEPVEYNGFTIRAAPYKSEGQYQTAGIITKEIGGGPKEDKFIPAHRHASYYGGVEVSLRQARPVVDQQGEGVCCEPQSGLCRSQR